MIAYAFVLTLCLLIWWLMPVSAHAIRPNAELLDTRQFDDWGLRINYAFDPPINVFPSLHVATSMLAALAVWKANRFWGLFGLISAALVAISICSVKQHYVVDGIASMVLAIAAFVFIINPYDSNWQRSNYMAFNWRGPWMYLALHISIIAIFYLLFLLGWEPWQNQV